MKYLFNLLLAFIVFNFIYKVLYSWFNPSKKSKNYKKTEGKKNNVNISNRTQSSKTGEYIDYEEVN